MSAPSLMEWSRHVAATPLPDVVSLLYGRASSSPSSVAIVCDGDVLTYEELWDGSIAAAKSFLKAGVNPNDRVGILLPTCIPSAFCFFGSVLAGAIPLLMHARYRVPEIEHVLSDAGARILVTDAEHALLPFAERVGDAIGQKIHVKTKLPNSVAVQSLDGKKSASRFVFSVSSGARRWISDFVAPDRLWSDEELRNELIRRASFRNTRDTGLILYTSGTTGPAKGVPLSQEALVNGSLGLGLSRFGLSTTESIWNPLPLYHIAGVATLLAAIYAGSKWIGTQHYDPKLAVDTLLKYQPTVIYPTWQAITDSLFAEIRAREITLPSLRVVLNAGHPRLLKRWQEELSGFAPNASQITGWGMTETSGLCVVSRPNDSLEVRTDTLGLPFNGVEIAAVDPETRQLLPAGQFGELVVRGRPMLENYWQRSSKKDVFTEDGWFLTGDQGAVDSKGYLHFNGRLRDVLKVGGENVSAAEVEAVLVSHHCVAEAQVIGIPDPRLGEVPAAYIKCKTGQSWSEVELVRYCSERLAPFKVPRCIREIDEWPMSATKVRKVDLRVRIAKELNLQVDA
jgi:fatty-acyl-CoA synthase